MGKYFYLDELVQVHFYSYCLKYVEFAIFFSFLFMSLYATHSNPLLWHCTEKNWNFYRSIFLSFSLKTAKYTTLKKLGFRYFGWDEVVQTPPRSRNTATVQFLHLHDKDSTCLQSAQYSSTV